MPTRKEARKEPDGGMVFDIEDGKIADRWRWLTYAEGDEELRLHVYIPESTEWNRFLARFRIGTPRADWKNAIPYFVRRWFDKFEGALDCNRKPIENSEPMRCLLLNAKKPLLAWIVGKAAEIHEEEDEGN